MATTTGIVLVHGIGNQRRYDFLKQFTTSLKAALDRLGSGSELRIDKIELNRMSVRSRETSDLFAYFGDTEPLPKQVRRNLFSPASIHLADGSAIRIYEAYWADEDLHYTRWEKLKLNFWLLTTLWNPLFSVGEYGGEKLVSLLQRFVTVALLDGVLHIAEIGLVCLSVLLRSPKILEKFGCAIHEYAGDVKLYYNRDKLFYNQTKHDVIQCRFDEAWIKAWLENDSIWIVGHSLGSVIAHDGIHQHEIHPSKMSSDWLEYLDKDVLTEKESTETIDLYAKLRGLVTVGSPLDKTLLFFPERKPEKALAPFRIERRKPAQDGERTGWTIEGEPTVTPETRAPWINVTDAADPLGNTLRLFEEQAHLAAPSNVKFADAWLPSTAHNGVLHRRDVMYWLAGMFTGKVVERPRPAGAVAKTIRYLWSIVLAGGSILLVSLFLFFALDLALGMARDLIMDAESRTAYGQLHPLAGALSAIRESMDVSRQGALHMALRGAVIGGQLFAWFLIIALPFSWYFHRKGAGK